MSPIPVDIINSIIDEIHQDRHTLKVCATVSKSFRLHSQKCLYSDVTIDLMNMDHQQRLCEVLKANPLLGEHVRTLRLGLSDSPAASFSMLQMMPQIHTFFIYSSGIFRVPWSSYPHEIQSELCRWISSSSLHKVTILNQIGFPIHTLVHCAHLKRLALWNNGSYDQTPCMNTPVYDHLLSTNIPIIETIQFHTSRDVSEFMNALQPSIIDLSRLRQCEISGIGPDDSVVTCQKLLDVSDGTLEHITLSFGHFASTTSRGVDLSSMRMLRSLHIGLVHFTSRGLQLLRTIIEHLPTQCLEQFTLNMGDPYGMNKETWIELDCLLVEAPHLSKVHIRLVTDESSYAGHTLPPEHIPLLMKRGNFSRIVKS